MWAWQSLQGCVRVEPRKPYRCKMVWRSEFPEERNSERAVEHVCVPVDVTIGQSVASIGPGLLVLHPRFVILIHDTVLPFVRVWDHILQLVFTWSIKYICRRVCSLLFSESEGGVQITPFIFVQGSSHGSPTRRLGLVDEVVVVVVVVSIGSSYSTGSSFSTGSFAFRFCFLSESLLQYFHIHGRLAQDAIQVVFLETASNVYLCPAVSACHYFLCVAFHCYDPRSKTQKSPDKPNPFCTPPPKKKNTLIIGTIVKFVHFFFFW